MNRHRHLFVALAILACATIAVPSVAFASGPNDDLKDAQVVAAELKTAKAGGAAGYASTDVCVELAGEGGMGYHHVNAANMADGKLDPSKPEVLVYVPTSRGRILGAVEYFQADADQKLSTTDDRPTMFGQKFEGPMLGHEPGMPIHYDLHVWVGKHNPDGLFAGWNPDVSCPKAFDWSSIAKQTYGRAEVGPCGGAAPVACVSSGGKSLGVVEHFSAPKSDFKFLSGVTSSKKAIRLVARDFIKTFRADRTDACPGHTYRAIRPKELTVGGASGVRFGFEMLKGDTVVDKVIKFGVVQDKTVHILGAEGFRKGACAPTENGFTMAGLQGFRFGFKTLAAVSDFS